MERENEPLVNSDDQARSKIGVPIQRDLGAGISLLNGQLPIVFRIA
jgi:hypothetical protein